MTQKIYPHGTNARYASDPSEHGGVCPGYDGDGLCVAVSATGASSGGVSLSSCIGLLLEYDEADVLARDDHKLRVRAVDVVGMFDVLRLIRSGMCSDLTGANLTGANLTRADLFGAVGRDDWDDLVKRGAIR